MERLVLLRAVRRRRGGEGYDAKWSTASTDVLDRYLLAKTHDLVVDIETQMDAYDIAGACKTCASTSTC